MFVLLYLTLSLVVCQSEGKVEEDGVLPPLSRSDHKIVHENDTWWLLEGSEERQVVNRDASYRHYGGSCGSTRNCCPPSGAECHYLGGDCLPSDSSTEHCDHLKDDPALCMQKGCLCCIDCQKEYDNSKCQSVRGRCRRHCECHHYEFADLYNSCPSRGCTCCRSCSTTDQCRYGGTSPGICLSDVYYYTRLEFVFANTTAVCARSQSQCSCVNFCVVEKMCTYLSGYCVKRGVNCRHRYVKYDCGCRDPASCSCCIPEINQYKAAMNKCNVRVE